MNATFSSYLELIIVDATYKLNEFHIPLYLLLIVDGNGQSEIIGIYLTSHETQEAIMKMMRCLKSYNLCWTNTRVIMTDKDFVVRSVFGDEFPDARLLLCFFHML